MARKESFNKPEVLTYKQRAQIFDKTTQKVTKHYFDPAYNGTNWPERALAERDRILAIEDPDWFELGMHDLVRSLRTSHTGFFHESVRRVPARLAIGANFRRVEMPEGSRWVVQDVHEGGPAHVAGLRPLDVLKEIDTRAVIPPEQPMFPMGTNPRLNVTRDSGTVGLDLKIPAPRSRKQPYSEPKAVISSILPGSIGYLKVTIFPGLLGLDVSREIDSAVKALAGCDRLILDLRGHLGGGLGVLRVMSYLAPGQIPIGYTVSRRKAEAGYRKEDLPKLNRLPTDKPNFVAVASLAFRYGGRDPSVVLVSEGLGPQKWHGRIVILVNEHTVSAGEMIAAFAQENNLAKIVGIQTAGRLIPGSGFKVGHGYMVIMPKAAYLTWQGQRFEGRGIVPDVVVPWSPEAYLAGKDNQLDEAAMEVIRTM
jgi:C-terminal processing protease CtpA/Prc